MLPGSRRGEVGRLARPFIETVAALREQVPDLQVVVPLVNGNHAVIFEQVLRDIARELPVRVVLNASRTALAAADVV